MVDTGPLDLRPDPRIGTDRPPWLPGHEWRQQLNVLTLDQCTWLAEQWEAAGGAPSTVDTSWVRMEDPVVGHKVAALVLCCIGVAITVANVIVWWP